MRRSLDRILVIDIECTCWEGEPPPGEVQEVIEIGACLVDPLGGAVEPPDGQLVKPAASRVSGFCTGLTTLTQAEVDAGVPFLDACHWLEQVYRSRSRVWASWGDFDRRTLEAQCRRTGVRYPFGDTHLNVKTWFALSQGLEHEVGMAKALDLMGMPLTGTHHRGKWDAGNIAAILACLLTRGRPAPSPGRPPTG